MLTAAQAQDVLAKDPQFQALVAKVRPILSSPAAKGYHGGVIPAAEPILDAMRARASALGAPSDYHQGTSAGTAGTLQKNKSFLATYGPLIFGTAALLAGPAGIAALTSGSGAGAATAGATTAAGTTAAAAPAVAAGTAAAAPAAAATVGGIGAGTSLAVGLAGLGLDAITTFYGMKQQGKALELQAQSQKDQTAASLEAAKLNAATQERIAGGANDVERARITSQEKMAGETNSLTREQFQLSAQLAREQLAAEAQRLAARDARMAPFFQAMATGLLGGNGGQSAASPAGGDGGMAPSAAPAAAPIAGLPTDGTPVDAGAPPRTMATLNASTLAPAAMPGRRTLADFTQQMGA